MAVTFYQDKLERRQNSMTPSTMGKARETAIPKALSVNELSCTIYSNCKIVRATTVMHVLMHSPVRSCI